MKLGIQIDERNISRYLPNRRASPDKLRNWFTFLRNHPDALVGILHRATRELRSFVGFRGAALGLFPEGISSHRVVCPS
jgi:hypothetical protein